jgi:hypothetical protein
MAQEGAIAIFLIRPVDLIDFEGQILLRNSNHKLQFLRKAYEFVCGDEIAVGGGRDRLTDEIIVCWVLVRVIAVPPLPIFALGGFKTG